MSNALTEKQRKLSSVISERLKSLRTAYIWNDEAGKQRRLSHEMLSQMLQDRNCNISKDSLINYEAAPSHETKGGKNLGMSVENLTALADFYGVSTDYILGRSKLPISDEAYLNLSQIADTPYIDTLNSFLSSSRFPKLISDIYHARIINIKEISNVLAYENPDITDMEIIEKTSRHNIRDLAEDLANSLSRICEFTGLHNAIKIKEEQIMKEQRSNGRYKAETD